MRIIKKISLMTSLVVGLSVFADPTVSDIAAKQRYPWNGLVDITCKVSGIEGKRKLVVSAVMPDSGKVVGLNNFWVVRNGEKSTNFEVSANGDYRLLWDAKADLGEVRYDNMVVRITLDDIHDKVQLWEGGPYWATTNIGAEKPEDYGYYFWWGDTIGYKRENDKWVASDGSSSGYGFWTSVPTYYKYISDLQRDGWLTVNNVLVSERDAAHIHWGNGWRMPMQQELKDLNNNCDWTWTSLNGVNGYIIRGRDCYNSASIFLPCCGHANGGSYFVDYGKNGYYWSSEPDYQREYSFYLTFSSSGHGVAEYYGYRYFGQSIRAIKGCGIVDCADDSGSFLLNTIVGPLNVTPLAYNSSWIGGNANATVVIADNGVEVKSITGEGEFTYSPTTPGKHTLTYMTYIDGVAQSEVYTATIFVDWKYTVEDGKATIVETTRTSGDVIIPSEIDGHSVVGIRDGLFAGCTSLKSIVIPESVTNVVVESKSLMNVDGAVAAYEFNGTLDDGTGYAPSGNGSFAADRFGIANSSYYFNGQEQQFVNTQKIVEGTFSFAFWFRTDVEMSSTGSSDKSGSGDGNYILFPIHGGVKRGYGAMVGTDGIKVMAHGDSYIAPVITYSNSIGSGWNHAVVTVSDNTNVKLYLNGECVATGTGPSATAIFRVDAGGNYGFYTGYLDDLVVCDSALDDAAVKEMYSWAAASFAGCDGIVDVTMPGGLAESMAEMFPDSYASITNVVLTGGVAQIPVAAFSGCGALESVTLADSGATLALGGDKGWRFDEDGILRSGKITHNELSSMSMTVQGEGRLTYRWKASCEYYNRFILDYAYLSVDSVAKGEWNNYTLSGTAIGGNTDWQEISVDISGEGTHDIAWTFAKDDQDDASAIGEDCAWVDAITYEPFIKLTFDVGEGDGTVPALIKDVQGASVSLPTGEVFAKAKHTFVGWSDGVQTYAPGGAYEIGATNAVLMAVYSPNTLVAPVISSVDVASGGEITTAAARIEITAEGDTAIYYTLDGSTPTSESLFYGGAFDADGLGQVTVKAIAVRDNYFDSDVTEFSFTRRPYSAAECLNASAMTFTMSGDAEWARVLEEASHDGDAALRSGAISHGNSCTIETKVVGPGTISFWWKVSSEIFRDWPLDIVSFTIDGVEHAWLGGVKDWTNIVVDIKASGEHTLCWTYKKDDQGEAGEDCAWLDEVVWTPDPIPELSATATAEQVTAALEGSADAKLAVNITTAVEYAAYRAWALGLEGVTPQQVKDSAYSWLSYALNTDKLIIAAPKEGDVVIDTFEIAATEGAFEFTVKIDGIAVGDSALEANLKKVFDVEGAENLASGGAGFSSDNVEVNVVAPENGNVKFIVTPKMGNGEKPDSFFFRVKMK